jgi:DNA-directed RNA polymerase specialized sigma24 family protein
MTVEALRHRRPASLEDLLDAYGKEIQGVAFLILRDRAAAEDVVVETLLTAFERAGQLRNDQALRPWILRIATNHALSVRRKGARIVRLEVVPDHAAPGDFTVRSAARLALLDGAQPRVEACARPDWPDMTDERSVEIAEGEALWVALDFGWQIEDVSISAAPLGDTGAGIPATRVDVPAPGAGVDGPLRIPVRDHLAPGSWAVAVTFVARHDVADDVEPLPEPFEAAMFLRVEILP